MTRLRRMMALPVLLLAVAGAPTTDEPKGPGGDPLPPGPSGEVLATIELDLVTNLLDVDERPRTLFHALAQIPQAGLDTSLLPPGAWLFGAAPLTRTESLPFAVAADRRSLVLDSDRDGRLEASERVEVHGVLGEIAWFGTHGLVRQEANGRVHEHAVPLRVGVALRVPMSQSRLDAYRSGTCKGPTRPVKVAIVDRTFRGWFTHPGRDALMVDVNGDGRFDASPDSTERYRLGEPFPLESGDAIVTAIGPLGATLTIARSPKPARRIAPVASVAPGAPAPPFEATSLDGKAWALEKLRGKWIYLDFWATWCGPCRTEVPHLKALRARHPDVVILGISADRARAPLDAFVAAQALDWPQVFDESGRLQRLYRVAELPTSFLVGPDGRIVARNLRGPDMPAQVGRLRAAGGSPASAATPTP